MQVGNNAIIVSNTAAAASIFNMIGYSMGWFIDNIPQISGFLGLVVMLITIPLMLKRLKLAALQLRELENKLEKEEGETNGDKSQKISSK